MSKRLYLIHPLETYGNPRENREKEKEIAAQIIRQNRNVELIRPFRLISRDLERDEAMKECFELIKDADGIIVTPDWSKSDGCRKEFKYARDLGKRVWGYYPNVNHLTGGKLDD